jgi:hypothetical protein
MGVLLALAVSSIVLASASVAGAASTFYVLNAGDSQLTGFTAGVTGVPASLGVGSSPTGTIARAANISPDGTKLFQVNTTGPNVAAWSIAANGGLSAIGAPIAAPTDPQQSAISPNGRNFYVTSGLNNNGLQSYAINPDGTLAPIDFDATTGNGFSLAVTPDNRFLYYCTTGGLRGYSVSADGSLEPLAGVSPDPVSVRCTGITITPDGTRLVYGRSDGDTVYSMTIAQDGTLTARDSVAGGGADPNFIESGPNGNFVLAFNVGAGGATQPSVTSYSLAADGDLTIIGAPVTIGPAATFASGGSLTPDGLHAYSPLLSAGNNMAVLSVSSTGVMFPISGSPFPSGGSTGSNGRQSLAFKPAQGPVSRLSASGGGLTRTFSAEQSTDADSPITQYVWTFGPGETVVTSTPTTSHTFPALGTYDVTVRAISTDNCGVELIYTGRFTKCNPGSTATTTVDVALPLISGLKLSRSKFKVDKKSKTPQIAAAKTPSGSELRYALSAGGTVAIQIEKPSKGREVGANCVKPSKSNKKRKACTRNVAVGKALRLPAAAGSHTTPFSGKAGSKALKAGKYRVTLSLTDSFGLESLPKSANFTIVK